MTTRNTPPVPTPPRPGSPEFLAMIERHKDAIEHETGTRPDFILDIGIGDQPGYLASMERAEFVTQQLMTEHPPVLYDRNKRAVFDIACPAGCVHGGTLSYTRWLHMELPDTATPADAVSRVEARDDVYDYAPSANATAVEWHVNFADPRLFVAYGSGLFAQDEMQVAEHPSLGALREALLARDWSAKTAEQGRCTPVLVKGVERRCRVATDRNAAEGRARGLYGSAFSAAPGDIVRRATAAIEPPTITNLIAIAAPFGHVGRYTPMQIDLILETAYTGFRAAVIESDGAPAVVHTGFWGCGAFGGHRVLMAMLQVLAAEMAGVKQLVFHTFDSAGRGALDDALRRIRGDLPALATETSALVQQVAAMGFNWGASNGT